jgi:peptidoglycan-N-acetylglucosamine deacetylase
VPSVTTQGPPDLPLVALTFDDGPDTLYSPQILDILERAGAPASFYIIGQRAAALPEVTLRMAQVGEVGNHAWADEHLDLRALRPEMVLRSLRLTHEAIEQITGQAPVTFRPPFGFYNSTVLATADRFGYQTVLWDVDSLDWQSLDASQIRQNVLPRVEPGSIVLMHSGITLPGEDLSGTVAALPGLIEDLRRQGYQLVTVAEMLGLR